MGFLLFSMDYYSEGAKGFLVMGIYSRSKAQELETQKRPGNNTPVQVLVASSLST